MLKCFISNLKCCIRVETMTFWLYSEISVCCRLCMHNCLCKCFWLTLTCQCVWVVPDWVDPGWMAGCGYSSRQLSGIWATSSQTWWRGCSPASADGAVREPCETWARSHPLGFGPLGSPLLPPHWPPLAARRPRCCLRPRWWGTDRLGSGPRKGERARRWQRGSQWCQSRQRGGGQEWWSGTAVRSEGERRKLEGIMRGCHSKIMCVCCSEDGFLCTYFCHDQNHTNHLPTLIF